MSDLLAVFPTTHLDEQLLEAIAAAHPDRVTVLLSDPGAGLAEDSLAAGRLRERMAALLAAIEARTGATVVGVAGAREQLHGWRFDRELGAPLPLAA